MEPARRREFDQALAYFEMYLTGQDYVAGKEMTIADLSLVASAASMQVSHYCDSYYTSGADFSSLLINSSMMMMIHPVYMCDTIPGSGPTRF